MLGSDLQVAPAVEEGARSRQVYLPGDATTQLQDLRDGAMYDGGQTITAEALLNTLPVSARDSRNHELLSIL